MGFISKMMNMLILHLFYKQIENVDDELSKLVNFEKNKQLNTYSLIYFNKIKDKILANES